MNELESIKWIDSFFRSLQINQDPSINELWNNHKLKYVDDTEAVDIIDEANSKLMCTCLVNRQQLLIILPDDQTHRGSMMFGTTLIMCAYHCIEDDLEKSTVLFFGTSPRFKYSLAQTAIRTLTLDSVFSSTQTSGKYNKYKNRNNDEIISEKLPQVVCVFHPVNPVEYINAYKPSWIALDLGNENEVDWVEELLSYCQKKAIPVIAWGNNNLSKIIELFLSRNCKLYFSPKKANDGITKSIGELFYHKESRFIEPIVFSRTDIEKIDNHFQESREILRRFNLQNCGPLKRDTVKVCWVLLKTLEQLVIPMKIFNTEARSFRFVPAIDDLQKTIKRYLEYLQGPDLEFSGKIEKFNNHINDIIQIYLNEGPPKWRLISEFCMDRSPEGTLRIIVFPKRYQKQLFSYTLLSRNNIKEDELFSDSRILIRTLKELCNISSSDSQIFASNRIIPIFIGLPDYSNRHYFCQIINKWDSRIIIYPYQALTLKAIIADFNSIESQQKTTSIITLQQLSNVHAKLNFSQFEKQFVLPPTFSEVNIAKDKIEQKEGGQFEALIAIGNLETEISRLFSKVEQDEEESDYLINIKVAEEGNDTKPDESLLLVENAIEFLFQDNYHLILAPDERLSVLKNDRVESIFCGAVKAGDKIVFVDNQSRQDVLYNLIISRVHNHPSLEVHVSMLKKWNEDFFLGYSIWKDENPRKGLPEFLERLNDKGSVIMTPLTINNWLNGCTLRPRDHEDIRRVGEILNLKFLKENSDRIFKAASRIVGIHISLSRKLKDWVERKATSLQHDDMELIDSELGLTFGELRSSIKILKVISRKTLSQPILRNYLGYLTQTN